MLSTFLHRSFPRPRLLAALAALALAVSIQPAQARFVFTLQETGSGVTITGTGSLDTTGLTIVGSVGSVASYIDTGRGTLFTGPGGIIQRYAGLSGPPSFGTSTTYTSLNSTNPNTPGNFVGVATGTILILNPSYVSGTALSNSSSAPFASLNSLGFLPGTYTYTLPSGDTLVVTGVPEPSTWATLAAGAGLLGAGFLRRHTRA